MDRINFTGDYRFEAHSIWGSVPAHYDGMQLQKSGGKEHVLSEY